METAEDDIDGLDTRVTALEQGGGGDISALAARVTQCEDDIDDLQSDMTSAQGSITTLQSTVAGHTSSISSIQSDVSGLDSDVSSLLTRMGDAETDIDSLEGRVTSTEGSLSSLSSTVAGHTTSIASLIAQLDGLYLDVITSTDSSEWTVGNWATRSCFMQCVVIHDGTSGIMIGSFGASSNSSTASSPVWPTLRLGTFTHWKIGSSSNEPYGPIKIVNNAWANAAAVVRLGTGGGLYWTFWTGVSGSLPAGEKVTGVFVFPVTRR